MIVKIYGERNSGTGFLYRLLAQNIKNPDTTVFSSGIPVNEPKNILYAWKHGVPIEFDRQKIYPDMPKPKVLYVCIFRNLDSWLKSMFVSPYHLTHCNILIRDKTKINWDNYGEFLHKKHKIITETMLAGGKKYLNKEEYVNIDDNKKDIFEIRYHKINEHMKFYNNVDNIVHVNLEYLQKNTLHFLNFLKSTYNLNFNEKMNIDIPYTKMKATRTLDKYKNTIYVSTCECKDTINEKQDVKLEEYINGLIYTCAYKNQK